MMVWTTYTSPDGKAIHERLDTESREYIIRKRQKYIFGGTFEESTGARMVTHKKHSGRSVTWMMPDGTEYAVSRPQYDDVAIERDPETGKIVNGPKAMVRYGG